VKRTSEAMPVSDLVKKRPLLFEWSRPRQFQGSHRTVPILDVLRMPPQCTLHPNGLGLSTQHPSGRSKVLNTSAGQCKRGRHMKHPGVYDEDLQPVQMVDPSVDAGAQRYRNTKGRTGKVISSEKRTWDDGKGIGIFRDKVVDPFDVLGDFTPLAMDYCIGNLFISARHRHTVSCVTPGSTTVRAPTWDCHDVAKPKCAICAVNDSSRVGEHVWPHWFLALMDAQGSPPNGWSRNGQPILNSAGRQIALSQRTRVFLPVCEPCNGELAKRFEDPAIDAIEQLSTNRWLGAHTANEWQAVGLWWAKVGLMLGHPAARYEHRKLNQEAIRFNGPPPDYTWMVDGSPAPQHLSVFIHHASTDPGQTEATLGVPEHVEMSDGTVQVSHLFQIVTPEMAITVVSHPGMSIVHPLVKHGEAWELLHGAPGTGDLASLPKYGHRVVVFRQGFLAHEGFQIDSSETLRLASLFPHETEQVPEVYPTRSTATRCERFRATGAAAASRVRQLFGR